MFHHNFKSKTIPFFIIILFYVFVFAPTDVNAQDLFKVNDSRPGGGSGTATTILNDRDKTSTIWVLMGITTGLVLIYKFFIEKKEPKNEVVDSTSSSIMFRNNSHLKTVSTKITNIEKESPVNLYLGIRRDDLVFNKKTYVLGVSFNL
ncbi:MAG: hypothetical protein CO128_01045 [Ignavibacteriales bacterium CG_4_9_14_3_um_filter_30_11]|nr:MAG: hypothetical protein CO128_01045 [Ignavibacteriales bacterium CG_4_9_14_3_um_filter_30_11]